MSRYVNVLYINKQQPVDKEAVVSMLSKDNHQAEKQKPRNRLYLGVLHAFVRHLAEEEGLQRL